MRSANVTAIRRRHHARHRKDDQRDKSKSDGVLLRRSTLNSPGPIVLVQVVHRYLGIAHHRLELGGMRGGGIVAEKRVTQTVVLGTSRRHVQTTAHGLHETIADERFDQTEFKSNLLSTPIGPQHGSASPAWLPASSKNTISKFVLS